MWGELAISLLMSLQTHHEQHIGMHLGSRTYILCKLPRLLHLNTQQQHTYLLIFSTRHLGTLCGSQASPALFAQ